MVSVPKLRLPKAEGRGQPAGRRRKGFGWRHECGSGKVTVALRRGGGGCKVNKNDLVAHVADTAGLSRGDATKAVDAVFEGIMDALKSGAEVRLVGFGTFAVAERAASEGRNPRTGEKIAIPPSKQPKFKAGKALKDAIN